VHNFHLDKSDYAYFHHCDYRCLNIDQSACVQMASKVNQVRNVAKWNVIEMMTVVLARCAFKEAVKIHVFNPVLVEPMLNVVLSIAELSVLVLWVMLEIHVKNVQ